MGNVGDDPRVNQINDTMKVARFPLATNEVYTYKEGNQVQKTVWHTVVFWNKAADIVEAYVRKGIPPYVEGKIQSSTWEDREGNKRYSFEINGHNFVFIDGKREEEKEENSVEILQDAFCVLKGSVDQYLAPVCFITPENNKIYPLVQTIGIQLKPVFGDILNGFYDFTIQIADVHLIAAVIRIRKLDPCSVCERIRIDEQYAAFILIMINPS